MSKYSARIVLQVFEDDKLIIEATPEDIWGSQLEYAEEKQLKYFLTPDYLEKVIERIEEEGISPVRYLLTGKMKAEAPNDNVLDRVIL
jgi:hypothetical protein